MNNEGRIYRDAEATVVEISGNKGYLLDQRGVVCVNPDVEESARIYRKRFTRKIIFMPDEYNQAVKQFLSHPDSFTISMNGFSSISTEQARRYGVHADSYVEACAAFFRVVISTIKEKFRGAHLQVIDGASNMGVDRAILKVMDEFNMISLGFSCPQYMFYVEDDKKPVYVAETSDEYADSYIRSLDMLFATGGREQALRHDIAAACIYNKRIHFVDVMNMLSTTGGVPATIQDVDGRIKVDNAAAAFGRNISFYGQSNETQGSHASGDRWEDIFANVASVATAVCRQKMSPKRKFQ